MEVEEKRSNVDVLAELERPKTKRIYKIIVIGDSNVGKTCLTYRFCEGRCPNRTEATIGVDFREKVLNIGSQEIKLQLWDTAGQERFRQSMLPHYYRNVHAVVFVYDVTKPASFYSLPGWLRECDQHYLQPDVPRLLIGNKCDEPARVSTQAKRSTEKGVQEEELREPGQLAFVKDLLATRLLSPAGVVGGGVGGGGGWLEAERCTVLLLHAGRLHPDQLPQRQRKPQQQPQPAAATPLAPAGDRDESRLESSAMSMSPAGDGNGSGAGPLRLEKIADLSSAGPVVEPMDAGTDDSAAAADAGGASLAEQLAGRLPFRPLSLASADAALARRVAAFASASAAIPTAAMQQQQQVILALYAPGNACGLLIRGLALDPRRRGGSGGSCARWLSLRELCHNEPRDRLPSLEALLDRLAGAPLLSAPQFDVRATYLLFARGGAGGTEVTFCAAYPGAHCTRLFEPPPRLCNPLGCLSVRPRPWHQGSCARHLASHLAALRHLHGAVEREERVWSLPGRQTVTYQAFAAKLAGLLRSLGIDAPPQLLIADGRESGGGEGAALGDLTNWSAAVPGASTPASWQVPSAAAPVTAAGAAAAASCGLEDEVADADWDGEMGRMLRSRKPDLTELLWLLARDVQCAATLRRCFELYLRVVHSCPGLRSAYQLSQRNWTQLARCVRSQQPSLDSFSCPHLLLQLGAYRLQESLVHLLVCAHPLLDTQQLAAYAAGPSADCAVPARLDRLDRMLHLCEAAFALARSRLPPARVGQLVREFLGLLAAGRPHLDFMADVEANEAPCEWPIRWELLAEQRAGRSSQIGRVVLEVCGGRGGNGFAADAGIDAFPLSAAAGAVGFRCTFGADCRLTVRPPMKLPELSAGAGD